MDPLNELLNWENRTSHTPAMVPLPLFLGLESNETGKSLREGAPFQMKSVSTHILTISAAPVSPPLTECSQGGRRHQSLLFILIYILMAQLSHRQINTHTMSAAETEGNTSNMLVLNSAYSCLRCRWVTNENINLCKIET